MRGNARERTAFVNTRARNLAIGVWVLFGLGLASQAWMTWGAAGHDALRTLADPGPGSNPYATGAAIALAWLTFGVALTVLTSSSTTAARAVAVVGYAALALLYVNVMRERTYYGDFDNYFRAALNLREGMPLPARYLYPPLWAGVLAPLTRYREEWVFVCVWVLNLASTLAVFVVLPRVLERFGFSRPLALAATLVCGLVNVPLLRTLGYAQINMQVLLCVLLAVYWYPRRWWASAMVLAVAVHLKLSPLALAAAFLAARDVRWLTVFAVSVVAVGVMPGLAYGWEPYRDVLNNLRHIEQANGLTFRDNSIDSFVRATGLATGRNLDALIWPFRIILACACLALAIHHVRHRTFVAAASREARAYNALPALLILMVMVSPLVWEHHPVLLIPAYLVIATTITRADWPLFAIAYFFEFLMPTFDFYPWSYGRLVSPLVLILLAWRNAGGQSEIFRSANRRLLALDTNG